MSDQADLFGDAPVKHQRVPPAPKGPLFFPAPPTAEWARLLTASGHGHTVRVNATRLYTGEVLEMLSLGPNGRVLLRKDHRLEQIAPDPGCWGRTIFMLPREAVRLHRIRPMRPIGDIGTQSGFYEFAEPGETVPEELPLPSAVIGPEID